MFVTVKTKPECRVIQKGLKFILQEKLEFLGIFKWWSAMRIANKDFNWGFKYLDQYSLDQALKVLEEELISRAKYINVKNLVVYECNKDELRG